MLEEGLIDVGDADQRHGCAVREGQYGGVGSRVLLRRDHLISGTARRVALAGEEDQILTLREAGHCVGAGGADITDLRGAMTARETDVDRARPDQDRRASGARGDRVALRGKNRRHAATERHGVVAGQRVDRGVAQTAGQIDPVATGENDVGAGGAACDRRDRIAADPAASPHVVDRRRARRADLDRHIAELPGDKGV